MDMIVRITAPDGFTVDKSWKGNFSNEQELLEDFVSNHTFLVGYKFELIKGL